MSRSTLPSLFLAVLLLGHGAGCTYSAWDDARETKVIWPAFRSISAGPADERAARNWAVVAYQTCSEHPSESLLGLPTGPDGGPAELFVYRGTKRTPQDILKDLSPERRRAIEAARLVPIDAAGPVRKASATINERLTAAGQWQWSRSYLPGWNDQVSVIAVSRTGPVLESAGDPGDVIHRGDGVVFARDCTILLLPFEHPRPEADIERARRAAWAVTPFTAAADVVVIPAAAALTGVGLAIWNLP